MDFSRQPMYICVCVCVNIVVDREEPSILSGPHNNTMK